ncbi:DUF930 domain-containing protein [Rhizobium halophilum]|uniref:DUF930 domain-containing protein n=1 Tax=Rhizobium halophilum TaxID=2846852 RepID=UPI001EFE4CAF|nr:DUF930 domain-containing protein [Rhizobium halophilum]MCF6367346.1 DUF930 domain-containing protein [Rhizobium halophilum]
MRWGIPASILFHAVLAVILIFGLPLELPTPPEEEAVTVEIVEPPPEPAPEPEPEEPAEEEALAEEESPEPPPAEEQPPEPPPSPAPEMPAEEGTAAAPPIPTLRPVFEFGEETTGPRVAVEGNSSTEAAETQSDAAESAPPDAPEALAAAGQPDDWAVDEAATAPPETTENATEVAEQPSEDPLEELAEAKTLFSPDLTEDAVARTAMEDIPRSMRATQLCETELTEQLRNASPPRDPDFIPRSPLSEGTILELRQTAFRAQGQWYNLSFRCEINDEATKVVGFGFNIGAPVPRSQWRQRGFPGS